MKLGEGVAVAVLGTDVAGTTTVTSTSTICVCTAITVCMSGTMIGGCSTITGVCVGLSSGVGRGTGGAVSISGAGAGVVVSGVSVVSVPVGMFVGSVKSGVVGVLVIVLEGSGSSVGVVVVVRDVSIVAFELGDCAVKVGGSGVTELVGKGVGVRQAPGVLRLRYCGHSSSLMCICRRPPGSDSQMSLFCVCDDPD